MREVNLKMDDIFVHLFLFGIQIIGFAHGEEYCVNWDTGSQYCESCCGDWSREYCCERLWTVAVAVGCTLGALFLIGLCVVIVCIVVQKKGKSGRVIQPSSVGQPPVYTSTVVYHVPYGQQGVPYGNQGVSYGQQGVAPSPAYPPPPYPPSSQNLYGNQAHAAPEGLQSQPPASGGLPGNHRVV